MLSRMNKHGRDGMGSMLVRARDCTKNGRCFHEIRTSANYEDDLHLEPLELRKPAPLIATSPMRLRILDRFYAGTAPERIYLD